MIPHSKPAWIAVTAGFLPYNASYDANIAFKIGDSILGFQPSYEPDNSTSAPAISNTPLIASAKANFSLETDERINH